MEAPEEKAALEALQSVQHLTQARLDELITAHIGDPLLGVFDALARASGSSEDAEQRARKVHLMVLAFLMGMQLRGEIGSL